MTDHSNVLQLFDDLPPHIEAALRASIERFGVLVPVVKDQHGRILDGHHRARIAAELGADFGSHRLVVADDEEAREIARTLNADRRQLTETQRREVTAALRREGHSQRAIAGALGVSQSTIRDDIKQLSSATQLDEPERVVGLDGKSRPARRPAVVIAKSQREDERAQQALTAMEMAPHTVMDVRRAERVAREQEADRRRQVTTEMATVDGDVEIRFGDFRGAFREEERGTVDAIITDPPYPDRFGDLWSELGMFAAWMLKPNGVLAVMTGTRLELLYNADSAIGRHMQRRWMAVYLTPGQRWRSHLERVATGWKPILIYSQPDADDLAWINDDVFTSAGTHEADTRYHHWGQNERGFAELVERLTPPGALVVDPFLGGGTTALVCRDLGRRFVGCDVDAAAVQTTRERLA